jgi:uncharacterized repeat protein (TIGR03803 family)
MNKLRLWRTMCFVCVVCAQAVIHSPAQTFKTLVPFKGTDGQHPNTPMVQGADGNFYGTTVSGGGNEGQYYGVVFKVSPEGKLTAMYDFCDHRLPCPNGATSYIGLVLTTNGNFYGTTQQGGAYCGHFGCGTLFEITREGKFTTLRSFTHKTASLYDFVPVSGGNFYGVTQSQGKYDYGMFFKMTPAGKIATLYSFCAQANCADGIGPSGLMQAANGSFYGATGGGANYGGTIFKMTPAGQLTTLYSFCGQPNCADGESPNGPVRDKGGNLYGTTASGGANSAGCYPGGCGTIYKITSAGKFTTLYNFCAQANCVDGDLPYTLVEGTDGNFYGTTEAGGISHSGCPAGCGTIYKITSAGKFTTLYSFCAQPNCADGYNPGALVQGTDGSFYGATPDGGGGCISQNCGTIFSLSVGLRPFVKTTPTSGKVGEDVTILGNNLTGTTSVTFNGTAATFTVVSGTEIKTTVPSGATTGFVEVTTPKKTLKSNVVFRVTK